MSLSLSGCPQVGRVGCRVGTLPMRRLPSLGRGWSRAGLVVLQELVGAGPAARLLSWRGLRAWEGRDSVTCSASEGGGKGGKERKVYKGRRARVLIGWGRACPWRQDHTPSYRIHHSISLRIPVLDARGEVRGGGGGLEVVMVDHLLAVVARRHFRSSEQLQALIKAVMAATALATALASALMKAAAALERSALGRSTDQPTPPAAGPPPL